MMFESWLGNFRCAARRLYRRSGYIEVEPVNAGPCAHHWYENSWSSVI